MARGKFCDLKHYTVKAPSPKMHPETLVISTESLGFRV